PCRRRPDRSASARTEHPVCRGPGRRVLRSWPDQRDAAARRCQGDGPRRAAAVRPRLGYGVMNPAPRWDRGRGILPHTGGTGMTLDELRDRMKAARIEIAENRLELVRRLLADALRPIHEMDSRKVKTLEPCVTFDARRSGA